MRAEDLYSLVHKRLNDVTPLKGDCGKICNRACCQDSPEGNGMYLYPHEEKLYKKVHSNLKIEMTDFLYAKGKKALIAFCPSHCDRNFRPLACRIFPLVPFKKEGEKLQIIIDPRAKLMCPLANNFKMSDFDPLFVKSVTFVCNLLFKFKECQQFIVAQSELIEDYKKFI